MIFRKVYILIYNTYYLLGILDYAFRILLYFAIVIDVIEIFSGTLNIYLLMIDCKTFITPIDNFFIEIWTKRYFHLNGCRKNVIFYQRGWQAINVWSNHRAELVNAIILSKLSIFCWPYFSTCNKIGYFCWPNSVIYIYIWSENRIWLIVTL